MRTALLVVVAGAGGAAAAYLLDPEQGRRRRNTSRDRAGAILRRGSEKAEQVATTASSEVHGASERIEAATREDESPADDRTLVDRVESEIFRDPDSPKGSVNVDAVDGVVSLRGQLDDEQAIDSLVSATRKVAGVKDVQSFLHVPGEPAPNVESALEAG